ncbi:MAG: Rrf2 family transcriptional regulator [Armatimonadetes bacterium]|nr:Rrf2 family transcriptional regulator [Armatimonadota bacterium]
MKFSAQEEYGLRCLVSLARRGPGASMTIPEISEVEGLTASHVAKILGILRRSGFVTSTRGQQGGYQLAMKPREMVLRDVLSPLGGRLFGEEFCARHTGIQAACVHETDCALRPLWTGVQQAVDGVLGRYTVQDLLDGSVEAPAIHLSVSRPSREGA